MKPPLESKPTEALQIISGKHSWHIIDSKKGAKASAILYSIAETAKANGLNPFEYFKFLMEQLKEYPRNDVPEEELKKLMRSTGVLQRTLFRKRKKFRNMTTYQETASSVSYG
jgi:hypothetical protein